MKTNYSTKPKSKRKKVLLFSAISLFLMFGFISCNNEGETLVTPVPADGDKATTITSFTPDSGGIATPMIIVGDNFGTDTAKIKVYFKSGNDSIPASIIHSNGSRIYLVVPKLTYLDNLEVIVKITADNQNVRVNKFTTRFKYKTQTTVTTVTGTMFPDVSVALSKGGTLSTASFSCPMFLCVDAEKNVIIVERLFDKVPPEMDVRPLRPRNESGANMNGDFLMLNEANNSVVFMKNAGLVINAPTVSPDGSAIYVPTDAGADYFQMLRSENYAPRQKRIKITSENSSITNSNWKFSFVTNPLNGMIYTVMYNKQLVMIDPSTNLITVLCQDIGTNTGSDSYLAFNPKESNMLYVSVTNRHSIYKIDLNVDPLFIQAVPYAGAACQNLTGADARGWADGLLADARFNYPRQITFDEQGVMYIADCVNHCIRTIDTKINMGEATVKTLVGFPGDKGNVDGGPDIAKFNYPMGIAKAFDGTIYIADTRNYSIRKLAVQ